MIENINTIYASLPCKVSGFVMYDSADDYYTIVLNNEKSFEQNRLTYEHEIKHILNDDFHSNKNVGAIELSLH